MIGARKRTDFFEYLERICKHAAQILRADAAAIYLKEGESFVMRAGFGYSGDLVGIAQYAPGEGITGFIGLGNTVKFDSRDEVEKHSNHAGKFNNDLWQDERFHCWSLLGIPLTLGNHVFGLLKVENKRDGNEQACFSGEDVRDLEIFVSAITDGIRANEEILHWLGSLYVFVQIPFSDEFEDVYKLGIKQTVTEMGMRCEKVDEVELPIDILQQIYECIEKADIVIAEMTTKNPNVFYETGYAHALGKPTILLAQDASDIPFDLKHFKHLIYRRSQISELKGELKKVLLSTRKEIMSGGGYGFGEGIEHSGQANGWRRRLP